MHGPAQILRYSSLLKDCGYKHCIYLGVFSFQNMYTIVIIKHVGLSENNGSYNFIPLIKEHNNRCTSNFCRLIIVFFHEHCYHFLARRACTISFVPRCKPGGRNWNHALLQLIYMGLSINGDTPIAGWFIMEKTYSNG